MEGQLVERVEYLLLHNKHKEAKLVLSELLAQEPLNDYLHYLMANVWMELSNNEKALASILEALRLNAGNDGYYYTKAIIHANMNAYDDTEASLKTAIELDPTKTENFSLLALIRLHRKQFEEALQLANKALELDSENIQALNVRSTALSKLNRHNESFSTIQDALQDDPNNSYTHANFGWNLLEQGNPKKALHHFSESLKLDPNSEAAQAGMVEALKARYAIYRWFLKYSFWMGNLSSKYQWLILIGFSYIYRMSKKLSAKEGLLGTIFTPIAILLFVVAISSWVITPLSNLFLRLNPHGKYLLSKEELLSATFVGASLLLSLLGLLSYLVTGHNIGLAIGAFGFMMMVPLSSMFIKAKWKHAFLIYTGVIGVFGVLSIIDTAWSDQLLDNPFAIVFLLGFISFQWVANYMRIKENNV